MTTFPKEVYQTGVGNSEQGVKQPLPQPQENPRPQTPPSPLVIPDSKDEPVQVTKRKEDENSSSTSSSTSTKTETTTTNKENSNKENNNKESSSSSSSSSTGLTVRNPNRSEEATVTTPVTTFPKEKYSTGTTTTASGVKSPLQTPSENPRPETDPKPLIIPDAKEEVMTSIKLSKESTAETGKGSHNVQPPADTDVSTKTKENSSIPDEPAEERPLKTPPHRLPYANISGMAEVNRTYYVHKTLLHYNELSKSL